MDGCADLRTCEWTILNAKSDHIPNCKKLAHLHLAGAGLIRRLFHYVFY